MKAKLPTWIIYTSEWDFSNSADYTYDTNYISVTAGKATLLQVDQTHDSASEFSGGSHVGTVYSGGVLTLGNTGSCDGSSFNCAWELDESWTPQYSSMIGYWKLNEPSWNGTNGEVIDSSGRGFHGTAADHATTTVDSRLGGRVGSFDGNLDTVRVDHDNIFNILIGEKLSLMFWYKTTDTNGYFIGKSGGTSFYAILVDGNRIRPRLRDNSSVISDSYHSANVTDGKWHHCVVTIDHGNQLLVYVDGVKAGATKDISTLVDDIEMNSSFYFSGTNYNGLLDEIGVFKGVILSPSEIEYIYSRQSVKFSGMYFSNVINLGASGGWTNIDWVTSLPFSKELPGSSGNELSTDYASLVDSSGVNDDSDLSTDLIGLWHMNETVDNSAPGSTDYEDFSGLSNHGTDQGVTLIKGSSGILGNAVYSDASSGCIIFDSAANDMNMAEGGLSLWFKDDGSTPAANQSIIKFYAPGSSTLSLNFQKLNTGDYRGYYRGKTLAISKNLLSTGMWNHFSMTWSIVNDRIRIYINGSEVLPAATTWTASTQTDRIRLMGDQNCNSRYAGKVDEFSLWSRELHSNEVLELYRRGANRVKFQVRSCDDAACSGETWIGPDGTANTYFSELHNCSSINGATGECNGSVNVASPSLTFSDFVTAPSANQYFQYRAILESDDEVGVCAGSTTCMPSVSSIEIGPTGRYFAGSPTIVNNTPVSFSSLSALTETAGGTCTPTYQVSNDGATFYYWNGANWVVGASAAQSSNAAAVNTNLSSFVTDVAAGSLYWRAYLNSDGSQTCELDQLEFSYE
jgi:hypothetical protein